MIIFDKVTIGRWMISIESHVICEGIQPSFIIGLAVLLITCYVFNLQYQEEAARTLEFVKGKSSPGLKYCSDVLILFLALSSNVELSFTISCDFLLCFHIGFMHTDVPFDSEVKFKLACAFKCNAEFRVFESQFSLFKESHPHYVACDPVSVFKLYLINIILFSLKNLVKKCFYS